MYFFDIKGMNGLNKNKVWELFLCSSQNVCQHSIVPLHSGGSASPSDSHSSVRPSVAGPSMRRADPQPLHTPVANGSTPCSSYSDCPVSPRVVI